MNRFVPHLVLTATAFVWAGNWVVGRGLHDIAAPGAIGLGRWGIAALAIAPFAIGPMWRQRQTILEEFPRLALVAILGVTLASNSIYWGLRTTSATNGGLYGAAAPVFVIILAWSLFGQRGTWRQAVGIAMSVAGVAIVISRGELAALLRLQFGMGDLILIAGIFLWASYMVFVRAWPSRLSPVAFLGSIIAIGLICFMPIFIADYAVRGPTELSRPFVLGSLYLGIGTSVIGYLAWNWGLKTIGAARTSQYMYLMPLFAALQAVVLLDETIELFHVVSGALIVAGIAIATSQPVMAKKSGRER